jgi:hypothetical protein
MEGCEGQFIGALTGVGVEIGVVAVGVGAVGVVGFAVGVGIGVAGGGTGRAGTEVGLGGVAVVFLVVFAAVERLAAVVLARCVATFFTRHDVRVR